MKLHLYSLLLMFPVAHPDYYRASGNTEMAVCKASSLAEAITIFRGHWSALNDRGYAKQGDLSWCVAVDMMSQIFPYNA